MKFKKLLSLLTAGVMVTAMLPMSIANAKMEKSDYIYYEDFEGYEKEFKIGTDNTSYITRDDPTSKGTYKIADGVLEMNTSAKEFVANNYAGIWIYPKTNSDNYINTNEGVVHYEFKMKTTGVSKSEHLGGFATIYGCDLNGKMGTKKLPGLQITGNTYSTSWTEKTYSFDRTLAETGEWVTHRITIDKANGIYRYDLYNAAEQRVGGFEMPESAITNEINGETVTGIPDAINKIKLCVNTNGKMNEDGYNTTMYFDDFKVWQDKPDNTFIENFDGGNFATTNITSIADDEKALDGKALKIDPTSNITSTQVSWNENISTKDAPVTIDTRFRAKSVDHTNSNGEVITTTYLNQLSHLVGYNVNSTGAKTAASLVGLYDGATYLLVSFDWGYNKNFGYIKKFEDNEYITFRQVIDGKNQTYHVELLDDDGNSLGAGDITRRKQDNGEYNYTVPDYINASRIGFDKGNGQEVYIDSIKVTKNFQKVEKAMPLDKEISADDTIKLVFKYNVDSSTLANALSLTKNGEATTSYTATLANDGKTVEIRLSDAVGGDKYTVAVNDNINKNNNTLIETEAGYEYKTKFTIAKTDGVYYENFAKGVDGESWNGASNLSINKLKSVESVSDPKATNGKAVKVVTGVSANTSGYSLTVNTNEEFDLSNGPIETYARVKVASITKNVILNNFYNIGGYYMDGETKRNASYCGLYGTPKVAEKLMMWYTNAQNAFPSALLTGGEYVTIKFTINTDGSYKLSYSTDDVNYTSGKELTADALSKEKLPKVINKLVFSFDAGTEGDDNKTDMEYYIDYIKVVQEATAKLTISEPTANATDSTKYDVSATFDYKLQNYNDGVNVYIAAYNDGVLEKVDIVSSDNSAKGTVTATVEGVSENAEIKAFVWDNNMKPIDVTRVTE